MGFVFILSGVKYLWMENSRPQGTEFVSLSELLHSVLDPYRNGTKSTLF